jgi:hypothetical protein
MTRDLTGWDRAPLRNWGCITTITYACGGVWGYKVARAQPPPQHPQASSALCFVGYDKSSSVTLVVKEIPLERCFKYDVAPISRSIGRRLSSCGTTRITTPTARASIAAIPRHRPPQTRPLRPVANASIPWPAPSLWERLLMLEMICRPECRGPSYPFFGERRRGSRYRVQPKREQ